MDLAPSPADALSSVLEAAGAAHHEAFAATDGADDEWPLWYAEHIEDDVEAILGRRLTRSKLVQLLVNAEEARTAHAPETPWWRFYAHYLLVAGMSEQRS